MRGLISATMRDKCVKIDEKIFRFLTYYRHFNGFQFKLQVDPKTPNKGALSLINLLSFFHNNRLRMIFSVLMFFSPKISPKIK